MWVRSFFPSLAILKGIYLRSVGDHMEMLVCNANARLNAFKNLTYDTAFTVGKHHLAETPRRLADTNRLPSARASVLVPIRGFSAHPPSLLGEEGTARAQEAVLSSELWVGCAEFDCDSLLTARRSEEPDGIFRGCYCCHSMSAGCCCSCCSVTGWEDGDSTPWPHLRLSFSMPELSRPMFVRCCPAFLSSLA